MEQNKTLAIKYRPKSFKDVSEQGNVIAILENQLKTNTFKQAYLFTGGAGTGKTTCARILAQEINKYEAQPIEMDAADNNSVEDARSIISDSKLKPLTGNYKIYVVDECHMFSIGAWNALLKTLEEPPAQAIFIFCTTDPQKIPNTVLSRVQRFNFQRISPEGIFKRLSYICKAEKIKADEEALLYVSKIAEGGMRDAISILDKCISYNSSLSIDNINDALGLIGYEALISLYSSITSGDEEKSLEALYSLHSQGNDLKQLVKSLISFSLDINKYALFNNFKYVKISSSYKKDIDAFIKEDKAKRLDLLDALLKLQTDIKYDSNPLYLIEAFVIVQSGVFNVGTK